MRIFYAAGASPDAVIISESKLWEHNLFDSLVEMGHEVIPFSKDVTWHFTKYPSYRVSPIQREKFLKYRSDLQTELIREITTEYNKKKIDLFFSYFWSEIFEPETLEKIKSMGIKTVNWFCNASYQFHLIAELAPHYDWCLVPEKFRLKDYAAIGARPIYCQEAANPNIYKPSDLPVEFDVVFVGQAYGDRSAYIKYLLDKGIDVRVWGSGWKRFSSLVRPNPHRRIPLQRASNIGRKLLTAEGWQVVGRRLRNKLTTKPANNNEQGLASATRDEVFGLPDHILGGVLSDTEMIQMYSRVKINLGFSTCGETQRTGERVTQVRLRDFEVPMSGGFYMVEYMEELEEFFDIGREIVCYTGPEDLADKIKYYLRYESEREAIREAGYERCRRDHTWRKRFDMAFKEMGLIQMLDGVE